MLLDYLVFLRCQLAVLIDYALGNERADILFTNAKIVDVFTGKVESGSVAVVGSEIAGVIFDGDEGFYEAEARSFTKGTVSRLCVSEKFLHPGENVLILDDFLAYGEASLALADMVRNAGGNVAGIGAVIEKGFQGGSEKLRAKGYRVESLAVIEKIEDGVITFEE